MSPRLQAGFEPSPTHLNNHRYTSYGITTSAMLVAMLAPSETETVEIVNGAPTHISAMAASPATLVSVVATATLSSGAVSKGVFTYSSIANAVQTEALSEATLVAMAAASETALATEVPPSTYCLNEEDFVASLLSSGAVGMNEDTTLAVGGEKTGVASSAGSLDEDTLSDAMAEQDMELHYYRSHKASFNMQAFPPGEVTAKNTKFKPKTQIVLTKILKYMLWAYYLDLRLIASGMLCIPGMIMLTGQRMKLSLSRKRKFLLYSSKPIMQATS